jgi:hypothetical protein
MSTYHVAVYLSRDLHRTAGISRRTGDSFAQAKADGVYDRTIGFCVDADGPHGAAEAAWAVCNSYPEEMFCGSRYAPVVDRYRADRNRSMAVGDVVAVTDHFQDTVWLVATEAGFAGFPGPIDGPRQPDRQGGSL